MANTSTLYYVHDPMCSWCWGFVPTWERIQHALPAEVSIEYLLGGLAADTDQLMPADMQQYLQQVWRNIQVKIPNTEFNFEFWEKCSPRRSTYAACRAILVAKEQGAQAESAMIRGIQQAYYLQARNPSDISTLASIADELGIYDIQTFKQFINAPETIAALNEQISYARSIGGTSFPSLIFYHNHIYHPIQHSYLDEHVTLLQIQDILQS